MPPREVGGGIALGACRRAVGDQPARITVYRRPVETRAVNERARATLVHDVVVEQVAELLGLEPETVDPDYGLELTARTSGRVTAGSWPGMRRAGAPRGRSPVDRSASTWGTRTA